MLASKAPYAASMLVGSVGAEVVQSAAQSDDPIVRVAAAAAAAAAQTSAPGLQDQAPAALSLGERWAVTLIVKSVAGQTV